MKNSKEYNKENYKRFWWKPEQIKARSLRNSARRIMEKRWLVKKGDNKEVNHIKWTNAWNWDKNIEVISRLRNRINGQKKAMIWRTHTYNTK